MQGRGAPDSSDGQAVIDCREAAESAGLTYASTDDPGISRHRAGKGFSYRLPDGSLVTDRGVLKRIRSLVIPPAWNAVWICQDPDGHIQAIGRDEKSRRQYRYHPRFRNAREEVKFEHMTVFAEALPGLRRQVATDMAAPGLGLRKVLATIVHLLETTMIRVGNAAYAAENKSYGLTTLRTRHVEIDGAELRFHFKGKSGKIWKLNIRDRRVAKIVKRCQDLPGQHLFQYLDEDGERQTVTSADVTAKDFRTWNGTVMAAMALVSFEAPDSKAGAKKMVTRAIEQVSATLGNTPTICRKCYVHPQIVTAYLDGELRLAVDDRLDCESDTLRPEETAVLGFLRVRAGMDMNVNEPEPSPPSNDIRPSLAIHQGSLSSAA